MFFEFFVRLEISRKFKTQCCVVLYIIKYKIQFLNKKNCIIPENETRREEKIITLR